MTRTATLSAINCTSCGAGLDLLGGGRVTTHVCPYCGSELDANDDYRVLRTFANLDRPDSPFGIGMEGEIKGVRWTVIGTLGKVETWGRQTWRWVEHQLYSPTHGYAWLVVEDGHLVFSRRFRKQTKPGWMGPTWVETADNRPSVRLGHEIFHYYETSTAQTDFAEGEFTFAPKQGQKITTVSAMSKTAMLDFSETGSEREVYRNEFLDTAQTLAGFGLAEDALRPRGIHPLKPFKTGPHSTFIRDMAILAAAALVLLGVFFSMRSGTLVLEDTRLSTRVLPREMTFDIANTAQLVQISLRGDPSNSWSYFLFEVLDPEAETLFEAGRTIEYYSGRDSDGAWSEGSRSASIRFRPTIPGTYTLIVDEAERGTWGSGSRNTSVIDVRVESGLSSGTYPFLAALGFGLIGFWHAGRGWVHQWRRWRGSDWSDED